MERLALGKKSRKRNPFFRVSGKDKNADRCKHVADL
jgi:hypothetical protein